MQNKKSPKIINVEVALVSIVSGIISILSYFATECILYSVASALDKMNFKSRVFKGV